MIGVWHGGLNWIHSMELLTFISVFHQATASWLIHPPLHHVMKEKLDLIRASHRPQISRENVTRLPVKGFLFPLFLSNSGWTTGQTNTLIYLIGGSLYDNRRPVF
jgi:hypothetical protein